MTTVLLDIADRIATVTMHRPEARNALSSQLLRELRTAMATAEGSDDVDVIILTGTDPAFSAGLDLKELGSPDGRLAGRDQSADAREQVPASRMPWDEVTKPLIGAVNGVAVTGGFELALLCDFLVASERAAFADTHARVGILPGWGLSVNLPAAVGMRRAIEMSMTGNYMHAQEALQFGMVNHVVPHDELMPTARRIATDIVNNHADAVRTLLGSYRQIALISGDAAWTHEAAVGREWMKRTFDPANVANRRAGIMDRGRSQV
jgi:enoyl-CoA hydratase